MTAAHERLGAGDVFGPPGDPGRWHVLGLDEKGFPCLDEQCPGCGSRALIVNEWDSAECLACAWREREPPRSR